MSTERAQKHAADNGWYPDPKLPDWWKRDGGGLVGTKDQRLDVMLDHDDACCECGVWIEYGSNRDTDARLRAALVCFRCSHYLDHIEHLRPMDAIVDRDSGERWGYYVSTRTGGNPSSRGMAGRHFTVEFFDGRTVETEDLWCWGTAIPEHFWDRLPVNAKFAAAAGGDTYIRTDTK